MSSKKDKTADVPVEDFYVINRLGIKRDHALLKSLKKKISIFFRYSQYASNPSGDYLPRTFDLVRGDYTLLSGLMPLEMKSGISILDSRIRALKLRRNVFIEAKKDVPQSLEEAIDIEEEKVATLQAGEELPYHLDIGGNVSGVDDDPRKAYAKAKRTFEELASTIGSHGHRVKKSVYGKIFDEMRRSFVLPYPKISDDTVFLSSEVKKHFILGSSAFSNISHLGSQDTICVYLGEIVGSGMPFFIDLYHSAMFNYNLTVVGIPGAGKTTVFHVIADQLPSQGVGVLLFDVKSGECVDFTLERGGVVISPGYAGRPRNSAGTVYGRINIYDPMGIPLPLFKRRLARILSRVWGLSEPSQSMYYRLQNELYKMKGMYDNLPSTWSLEPPTADDMYDLILREKKDNERKGNIGKVSILDALELRVFDLTSDGALSFLGGKSEINLRQWLKGGLICYDFSEFGSVGDWDSLTLLTYLSLNYAMSYLGKIRNFWIIMCDEGKILLRVCPDMIDTLVRWARGFKVGFCFSVQNLRDYSEEGATVLRNSFTKMIGKIDKDEIDDAVKKIGLPRYLAMKASDFRDKGEFLVWQGNWPVSIHTKIDASRVLRRNATRLKEDYAKTQVCDIRSLPDTVKNAISAIEGGMIRSTDLSLEWKHRTSLHKIDFIGSVTISGIEHGKAMYYYDMRVSGLNPSHTANILEIKRYASERGMNEVSLGTSTKNETDVIIKHDGFCLGIEWEEGTHDANELQKKIYRLDRKAEYNLILVMARSKVLEAYRKKVKETRRVRFANRAEFKRVLDKILKKSSLT